MSSAAELINIEIDGSSFAVLSTVNSWGTTTDDVPCADGLMVCSGTTADDVPCADGSIDYSGASAVLAGSEALDEVEKMVWIFSILVEPWYPFEPFAWSEL
jgi:hypothetical protein